MILQEKAFRQQLSLASEMDCPIVIHSRNAFEDSVRMIDESKIDWARIVFHCFSYGPDEIMQINQRGGRASFTGIVSYKNAPEVRKALQLQGIEQLMLETGLEIEPERDFVAYDYLGNTGTVALPMAAALADQLPLPSSRTTSRQN